MKLFFVAFLAIAALSRAQITDLSGRWYAIRAKGYASVGATCLVYDIKKLSQVNSNRATYEQTVSYYVPDSASLQTDTDTFDLDGRVVIENGEITDTLAVVRNSWVTILDVNDANIVVLSTTNVNRPAFSLSSALKSILNAPASIIPQINCTYPPVPTV